MDVKVSECLLQDSRLGPACAWLESYHAYKTRGNVQDILDSLDRIKKSAILDGGQLLAKAVWCAEQIATVQQTFIEAYERMRRQEFNQGWCLLEQTEIRLHHLDRHFREPKDQFGLEHVRSHVVKFQDLFPYRLFISPEFRYKETRCNICNKINQLRNPCGHEIGEIYDGEQCGRNITKIDILGLALVHHPAHKYSVLQPLGGESAYEYPLVRFLSERLASPWDSWSVDLGTMLREQYHTTKQTDACPCNSGKLYVECCLGKAETYRPHYSFTFEKMPPPDLPEMVIVDD